MKSLPAGNQPFRRYPVALALLAVLAIYGFTAHARRERIATPASSGDQGAYMAYARQMYETNYMAIGERNRMPIFPFLLSLVYRPGISEAEFLQRAQAFNVNLSIVFLLLLFFIFRRYFPAWRSLALVTATAFGVFLYRAPYAQTEVLFYFLSFAGFLVLLEMLVAPRWWLAGAGGVLIGLAYLSKASILPALGIWLAVFAAQSVWESWAGGPSRSLSLWKRLGLVLIVLGAFTVVLLPYMRTNKQVFGHYLYNENSTFVMWCDSWPEGKEFLETYGPNGKWRSLPADQIPSASKYWREHSVGQIIHRLIKGLIDLAHLKVQVIGYYKYVVLFILAMGVLCLQRPQLIREVLGKKPFATAFCLFFLSAYIILYAWYGAIVKDTRFVLSIFLPFVLVASAFISQMGKDHVVLLAGRSYRLLPIFFGILAGLALVDVAYNAVGGPG